MVIVYSIKIIRFSLKKIQAKKTRQILSKKFYLKESKSKIWVNPKNISIEKSKIIQPKNYSSKKKKSKLKKKKGKSMAWLAEGLT